MENVIFENALRNADLAGMESARLASMETARRFHWPVSAFSKNADDNGACGFAWVVIPGNSALGRYVKKKGIGRKGYPSGIHIWISYFGQSVTLKEAYASAFAKSLQVELGMSEIYSASRLD